MSLPSTRAHIDEGHSYAQDKDEILDTGVTYVFIGNEDIHGDRQPTFNVVLSNFRLTVRVFLLKEK